MFKVKASKIFTSILAFLILFFIVKAIDLSSLLVVWERLSYFYLVLFAFISLPLIWASSMKWSLFISSQSKPSILKLMEYYTISYFANLFLPSSLGGDAARSLKLGNDISSHKKAFIATFFERYTGLISLLIVSLIGNLLGKFANHEIILANIFILIFVLAIFILLLTGKFIQVIKYIKSIISLQKYSQKLDRLLDGKLPDDFRKFSFLLQAFTWSFLFYVLTVVNTYLGLKTFNVTNYSIIDLFYVVPLVLFVSMLPITPGALGVQEGAFIYFLGRIGVSSNEALALALLLRLKSLLLALIGWFFYLKEKK